MYHFQVEVLRVSKHLKGSFFCHTTGSDPASGCSVSLDPRATHDVHVAWPRNKSLVLQAIRDGGVYLLLAPSDLYRNTYSYV